MATDGSHVIKLFTGATRRFSKITAKDDGADTVTVEDSFTISAPGVNWAIGGKLQTLEDAENRTLFVATNGAKPGWVLQSETDQTINSELSLSADGSAATGWIHFRGAPSSGETIKITQTANAECLNGDCRGWRMERLQFSNSNGTKTNAHGIQIDAASAIGTTFYRCIFGDATDQLNTPYSPFVGSADAYFVDCEFRSCLGPSGRGWYFGCVFRDMESEAISVAGGILHLVQCIVTRCSGGSLGVIAVIGESILHIVNCTFHDNEGSGLYISSSSNIHGASVIYGNQFTSNGQYGINVATGTAADLKVLLCDFNNFHGNSLGARNGISAGPNDMAVDPAYVDAANDNFGVGQSVRAAGFPDSARTIGANQSQTNSFVDIGAAQRDENLGGVILGARRRVR